jgi:hypothetical protein
VAVQDGFDLAKLDAIATALDLIITAPKEAEVSVRLLGHEVACSIHELALIARIGHKLLCRLLLVRPIALHNGRAADEQFTLLTK